MVRTSLAVLALTGAVGLSGPAFAETELRFAHTLSTTDTHHLAAVHLAERVAERTDGEVAIVVHPAGELGDDPGILEGIRLGSIDMGLAGNPFYTRFAPQLNALDLPYLFSGYDHAYAVLDGEIGDRLLESLSRYGLEGLGFWEIGFRNVTNSVRPIETPDDLQGLKIRTTPNPAHVQAFELLGANPTPMAFTEVYLALETGTVDGQENPVGTIYAMRFFEVQNYLSLTRHAYTPSIVSINPGALEGLSPEHRDILRQAVVDAAAHQRDLNRAREGDAMAAMREAGLQVIEDLDIAPFRDIVAEAIRQNYVDEHGDDLLGAIDALQ